MRREVTKILDKFIILNDARFHNGTIWSWSIQELELSGLSSQLTKYNLTTDSFGFKSIYMEKLRQVSRVSSSG